MEEWLKIRKRSGRGVDEKNLEEERRKSSGRARSRKRGKKRRGWCISHECMEHEHGKLSPIFYHQRLLFSFSSS